MKTIFYSIFLIFFVAISGSVSAQRLIKGTVYDLEGKPAAGVEVMAHKTTDTYFTSFDGKYELSVHEKAKWIKFTMIDEIKKIDLTPDNNNIDCLYGKEAVDPSIRKVSTDDAITLIKKGDSKYASLLTYTDFYKVEKYKEAYKNWKEVLEFYPKSSKNVYIHGVNIMTALIKGASGEQEKKYTDELLSMYDIRMKYHPETGKEYLGEKGMVLFSLDKKRIEEAYKFMSEAVEEMKENSSYALLNNYMSASSLMFNMAKMQADNVIADFGTVTTLLEKKEAIATDPEDKELAGMAIEEVQKTFIGTPGVGTCENLVPIYEKRYNENPTDTLFLKKATKQLRKRDCLNNPLFEKMATQLYELEKSSEAAYNIAKTFFMKKDYEKAELWYNRAIESEEDDDAKADYYFELAGVMQAKESYSDCRKYALEALKYRKNWGKPYMLIGDAYVLTYKTCGDSFEQAAVFWVAIDKYNKAKAVDPSIAEDANKAIANYSKYFPKSDEGFMRGLTKGKSYTVGCWINETTTVRYK